MNTKVLLIAEKQSFMVNAIIKSLSDAGFDVRYSEPVVKKEQDSDAVEKVILFYLEGESEKMTKSLVYYKDVVAESAGDIKLFLVGNEEEINEAKNVVPVELVTKTYLRPLNVKELADYLYDMAEEENAEASRKKCILVVDDDGTMLRTIKLWLSGKYKVYMANSGMNAITLLAKNRVDLILLDYEMPVANGPQVLKMIRSEDSTRNTPVMFLTAKNDKDSVVSVMDLKPEKYLLKTMPPDQLMSAIEDFFASKEPTKASTYKG